MKSSIKIVNKIVIIENKIKSKKYYKIEEDRIENYIKLTTKRKSKI